MKKKIWVTVLILGVILSGLYVLVKFNPPLELWETGSSGDYKSVLVGAGNKGISEITILDVLVNDNETPTQAKIQVSNDVQGFIITDNFNDNESKKYEFRNLEETKIKTGTSRADRNKKTDDYIASKEDEIYGVSILNTEEIARVHIKYRYLGITYNETIQLLN